MLTQPQEEYILFHAYVPEHIVSLMSLISRGEPFLMADCLVLAKDNWAILVGYPLVGPPDTGQLQTLAREVSTRFQPEYLWLMAPEIPESLRAQATEYASDYYYVLNLEAHKIKPALQKKAQRAAERLTVEGGRTFSPDHVALTEEFLGRVTLPEKIRALYLAMPDYVRNSPSALVLDARNEQGHLSAFYVLDLAARNFTTYLLGCYSRENYVPYASDLLFWEMLDVSRRHGKKTVNLGLGVNDGIRRFKEKWGGLPALPYNFCECRQEPEKTKTLFHLLGRLFKT